MKLPRKWSVLVTAFMVSECILNITGFGPYHLSSNHQVHTLAGQRHLPIHSTCFPDDILACPSALAISCSQALLLPSRSSSSLMLFPLSGNFAWCVVSKTLVELTEAHFFVV